MRKGFKYLIILLVVALIVMMVGPVIMQMFAGFGHV